MGEMADWAMDQALQEEIEIIEMTRDNLNQYNNEQLYKQAMLYHSTGKARDICRSYEIQKKLTPAQRYALARWIAECEWEPNDT